MAQSDFNENDYQNRQAGLQAWLNGAGNATPAVPAYPDQTAAPPQPTITPMQAFIAGQVAQQNKSAQNAGFDTSQVNSDATTTAPTTADLSNIEPNQKAAALAQEAFAPGTQNAIPSPAPPAAPSTPFSNTTTGAILGAMMPHTFGAANALSRGKALTDYIQSIPSDNDPTIAAIQGMAKQDPANGEKYAGAISQYMANNQTPIAKTQAKTAALQEAAEEFKIHQLQAGMAAAAADAPGGGTQPAPITIPQAGGSLRGQPMPSTGSIAGAMNAMPNGIVAPIGGSAANPPPLPGGTQPAPVAATPAQPMTRQQQHIEMLRQQAAQGLIPYSDYLAAKDPTNPANIPKQTMEGGTLFSAAPGEAPAPYAVPPINKSNFKVGDGGTILPSKQFGFTTQPLTTETLKIQQENDKAAQLAAQSNLPIIKNAQRYIDALEPSLNDIKTGKGSDTFQTLNAALNGIIPGSGGRMSQMANDYGNVTSTTQSLALELAKLQPGQGSKGNKLALQTLINSKPGMGTPNQTNTNSLNDMRAKLSDIETSADLDQQYRAASPYGTTDANTRALDDALKTIYPLQSVDQKTGNVIFNQHNADLIRKIIPDAIARPQGYLKQAQLHGGQLSYDPTAAAAQPPADPIAAELARRQGGGQ